MSEKLNLYQKLVEVRKAVPYLQKDTTGDKYKYVSGSSVLSVIRKEMDRLGILLIPSILKYGVEYIEKKPTINCDMLMTWVNAENPEDRFSVPFVCFGTQDDISKAFGSALTYSERYFMLKFFNIPIDADDPDKFQKNIDEIKKKSDVVTITAGGEVKRNGE